VVKCEDSLQRENEKKTQMRKGLAELRKCKIEKRSRIKGIYNRYETRIRRGKGTKMERRTSVEVKGG